MRLSSVLKWLLRDKPEAQPPPDLSESLWATSFELADVGIAHVGVDGKILRANANFRALLGYSESEIVGLDKLALVHESSRAAVKADHSALSAGASDAYAGERVYLTRDGDAVGAWTSARRIGDPPVILLVIENVTARQETERALRESEERFQLAMRGANEGLWDWRVAEDKTYLSPRWKSMLGYGEDEIADEPSSWAHLTAPGVLDTINEQIRRLEAREIDTYELEFKLRHKDGHWLDVLSRGFPVFDGQHRVSRLVGTHQDITLRKRQEAELRLSSTVFANTPEGILIADFSGCIQAVNPAFETLTGYGAAEVRGRRANILRSGRHDAQFYQELYRDIDTTGRWRGEIWNRCKDGRVQPFWSTISVVRDDHGEPVGYVALYSDIGDFKRSQARLDFLAHHDADTALPNRLSLARRLESALVEIGERGGGAALFHLELDRFRTIVESLGHSVGDELLTQSSKRFLSRLNHRDLLARIGSDEFAILRQSCASLDDARLLAAELAAEMEPPFVFESGAKAYSGVNIGLTWFSTSGGDAELLMRQAESALYVAKDGAGVRIYEPRHMIEARERLEMEIGLRRALERDEFAVQFQPLIQMRDRRTFGVQALVRWLTPEGLVPPGRFIPLAEKTGLIVQIGEWVLTRAAQRMKAWLDAGVKLDTLAINISPRQFERPDLCERIADILNAAQLPFAMVEIEITESVLMEQKDAAAKLAQLRSLGLRISVDDFGTGHSSLAYLKNFPIDKLKLDRAFILDVPADTTGMEIASAVIRLGHSLDVEVLAEGVETEAQAEFLERSGCRLAQGYLFGRPMWEEDLLASLAIAKSKAA